MVVTLNTYRLTHPPFHNYVSDKNRVDGGGGRTVGYKLKFGKGGREGEERGEDKPSVLIR